MAASDHQPRADPPTKDEGPCLASAALQERLREEIGRAERHGTELSCLLVLIDNLDELAHEHGGELREETLEYVTRALRVELRRFDRVVRTGASELAIVLPGADSPRGEIVARRVLERLRSIKVEGGGARVALQVSVGLAAWREETGADELLARARTAARHAGGEERLAGVDAAASDADEHPQASDAAPATSQPPAFGSV